MELLELDFPVLHLSRRSTGAGCDAVGPLLFKALQVVRVYTKKPGKPAELTGPSHCGADRPCSTSPHSGAQGHCRRTALRQDLGHRGLCRPAGRARARRWPTRTSSNCTCAERRSREAPRITGFARSHPHGAVPLQAAVLPHSQLHTATRRSRCPDEPDATLPPAAPAHRKEQSWFRPHRPDG